ncbi:hypothetical protein [Brevundimonas sp.]|jgi:hypothetical protein|uniref:hypothetical protein n=1 Tax=Brevundimonas sp. TaxID=1871086 RepID=UPI0037C12612
MKVALIGVAAFLLAIIVAVSLAGGPKFAPFGAAWFNLALGAMVVSVFSMIAVAVVDAAARSHRRSQPKSSDER